MAEVDDYLANLRKTTATNYSVQPGVPTKPRQLVGGDPSDPSVHLTTHQPPSQSGLGTPDVATPDNSD